MTHKIPNLSEQMRKLILTSIGLFFLSTSALAAPQTMRLDYFHTGDAKHETFSMDRVVIEPLPWPGDISKSIDNTNLGKYFFEVRAVLAWVCVDLWRVGDHR
jgi:peptidase M64-like protein